VAEVTIVNASPLILLARIQHLDWLLGLSQDIRVPRSVIEEVEAGDGRDGAATRLRGAAFIRPVSELEVPASVATWALGRGETQVITHGLATPSATVVLDDLAARRAAKVLGLDVIGTAGLVALLRKRQAIPSAAAAFEALRGAGLRLSESLVDEILARVGESRRSPPRSAPDTVGNT